MERRKEETLGNVVLRYLRLAGLETPLAEHRLVEAWPEVAGEALARRTEEVYLRGQVLYVRISQPAARPQLVLHRDALIRALNEKAGARLICDIRCV